ncbi:MAG: UxaA family hydrolase, partial [Verrucomicrobiota bacterium]
MSESPVIQAWRRADGSVGIRNHVAVIPTVLCSSLAATKISEQVPGTLALEHGNGCCQIGDDLGQTERTLCGLGLNPNVAAVLVVSLGCEGVGAGR